MCKCDILKALGIQVDVEDGTESLQVLMSNELSGNLPSEEGTNNEPPPARESDKVTSVVEEEEPTPQNDSQPPAVADVPPSP